MSGLIFDGMDLTLDDDLRFPNAHGDQAMMEDERVFESQQAGPKVTRKWGDRVDEFDGNESLHDDVLYFQYVSKR